MYTLLVYKLHEMQKLMNYKIIYTFFLQKKALREKSLQDGI